MELEKQVCSLELAKRLKELNCKQESLWWWVGYETDLDEWLRITKSDDEIIKLKQPIESEIIKYSAFTVSECLEIYGEEVTIPKGLTNVANFIAKKIVDKLSA